jgi:hydrogenase/urease accessory protein HupE
MRSVGECVGVPVRRWGLCALLACIIALVGFVLPAAAHDARPLSVNITEQSDNLYIAHIRVPPTVPVQDRVTVTWPADCNVVSDDAKALATEGWETTTISCKKGLEGQQIKVSYLVYNPSLPTLFRLNEIGGKVITRVLPPDQPVWTVPKSPGWLDVAAGYLRLGIRHIWTGIDHLLFVTGLLILAGTTRRVLFAITGFTIAHSITLSLSALNLVVLPEPPVEAAIALSILFLAREIARPYPDSLAGRYPIFVSSSFGLLHGFGFAAALREVGLPTKELAVGLLCFNCGVEIGQITFIIGILAIAFVVRKAVSLGGLKNLPAALEGRWGLLGGYGLGIPAAFWFIQRLAAF